MCFSGAGDALVMCYGWDAWIMVTLGNMAFHMCRPRSFFSVDAGFSACYLPVLPGNRGGDKAE